jgi:phosphotransferase system enzyme I (PtsP)
MLLDLDAGKAAALLRPLVEKPVKGVSIREQLEDFAATEGLQL